MVEKQEEEEEAPANDGQSLTLKEVAPQGLDAKSGKIQEDCGPREPLGPPQPPVVSTGGSARSKQTSGAAGDHDDPNLLSNGSTEIIRVSIMYLDYYEDEGEELPVVRVFGRKPNGDSLLVHIHYCMPYMFVKKIRGRDPDVFVKELKEVLADSKFGKMIYALTVCKAIDFYGYHKDTDPEVFVKIELTQPMQLKPLGTFLQSGDHKLAVNFQPYETHVPYLLQFLSDYELAGMGYLRLADFETVSPVKRQTGEHPIGEIRANAWDIIVPERSEPSASPAYKQKGQQASGDAPDRAMHVPSLRGWLDELRDSLGVDPDARGSQAAVTRSASLADERMALSSDSQLHDALVQWLAVHDPSPRSASLGHASGASLPSPFGAKRAHSSGSQERVTTQDAIEHLRLLNDDQPSPLGSGRLRSSAEAENFSDAELERDHEDHLRGVEEGLELAGMTQQDLNNWEHEMSSQEDNDDDTTEDLARKRAGAIRSIVGGEDDVDDYDMDDRDDEIEDGEDSTEARRPATGADADQSQQVRADETDGKEVPSHEPTVGAVRHRALRREAGTQADPERKRVRVSGDSPQMQGGSTKTRQTASVSKGASFAEASCFVLRPREAPPSCEELSTDPVLENTEYHVKPHFTQYEDAAFERNDRGRRMWVPARKLLHPVAGKDIILSPRAQPPRVDEVRAAANCRSSNGSGGGLSASKGRADRISERVDKGTRAVRKQGNGSKISTQKCRVMLVEIIAATGTSVGAEKARQIKRMSNPAEDELLCVYAATFEDTELVSDRHIFQAINARLTNERMVLMDFMRYVRDQDPDIIGGWEIQRRSLGYILRRAEVLGIEDYAARLSRVPAGPQDPRHMNDSWGETEYSQIWLAGRHVFNVWRVIRKEIDLAQYTLEHVVQEFFGRPLPRFADHYLHGRFRTRATRDLAMNHLCQVVGCVHDVLMHLDVVTKVAEYAKLLGMDFFSAMTRGSQFQVESVMIRVAKPRNFVLPSPSRDQVASQPGLEIIALNLEPVSNMYVDPVAVLDFRSLYPSVIISHNLCFSTFVGKVDKSGALVQEAGVFARHACDRGAYPTRGDILRLLGRNEIFIAGNGACFLTKSVREGVLPCMLREILFTRFAIKDGLKKCVREGWDSWRRVLDARQLALKMLANVTYGYTSASFSGRMPMSTLADAIVVTGKQALEASMREVQSPTSPWRPVCPSKPLVVYGDTDSLFVQLPNCKLESAFHIANWVCEHMTMQFPHPMKLQFEKVYMPCMLVSKKRYCGLKYEAVPKPGDPPARIESKGLENIRRDSCPIMKRIMNDLLQSVFLTRDLSRTKAIFQDHVRRILENKISVRDFVFASKVRTPIEEQYKAGSYPPSVTVALRRAKADPMAYPVYKERVEYVIADGLPSARLTDLVQSPRPGVRINATYYLKRKIIEPLQRLFRLVNVDVGRWYTQMRKAQTARLPARSLGDNSAHRDGVRAYFQSQTCVVCKRSYAAQAVQAANLAHLVEMLDTDEKVCPACLAAPQQTALFLSLAAARRDRSRILCDRQCQACTGSIIHTDHCINPSCPVYYAKSVSQAW